MGNTNRKLELEAIDKRLANLQEQKEYITKSKKVAEAIEKMEQTPEYKLVIDEVFMGDEVKGITGHLAGDANLPEDMVAAMNRALATIRGYKVFIRECKEAGEDTAGKLRQVASQEAEEREYRARVADGTVDLGDQDG